MDKELEKMFAETEKEQNLLNEVISELFLIFLRPLVIMLVWNAVMPAVFGLPTVGYFMAWGLRIVAKNLFGRGSVSLGKKG